MAEINRAVKGTGDVLPSDSYKWQFVEGKMLETARLYGFNEIRIPVLSTPRSSAAASGIPPMSCRRKCIPLTIRAGAL